MIPVHSHTGMNKDKREILIELYSLLDENNVIFALFFHQCIINASCIRLLLLSYACTPVMRVEEHGPSIVILIIKDS